MQTCHLASQLAWSAIANGDRVGAMIFNDFEHRELKPRNRHHGALAITEYLVKMHNQGLDYFKQGKTQDNSFEQACLRLRRVVRPGSLIFLLSDFNQLSDKAIKQLQLLSRHNEIIACQMVDPLEQSLPSALSGPLAIDDGQQRSEFTLNKQTRAQYRQNNDLLQASRLKIFKKLNIKVTRFSSHLPLLEQIKSASFTNLSEP